MAEATKYRFRVIAPNGHQITSEIVEDPPGAPAAKKPAAETMYRYRAVTPDGQQVQSGLLAWSPDGVRPVVDDATEVEAETPQHDDVEVSVEA